MNAVQDRYRSPQIRASDADRDAVVAALSEHFQAGRLTTEELEERTGRALAARTLGQLDELTADLPASRPAAAPVPAAPRRPGYLVLAALVVPVAALAIVAVVLGTSTGIHAWGVWWVIPVALLIARRLAGRHGFRRDFRGGFRDGFGPDFRQH
jgi:Domain of unknown function (DUF1707)